VSAPARFGPLRAREVDLRGLSSGETRALLEQLYPAHKRIFASDDRAGFEHHILKPAADRARLLVLERPDGAAAGYCGSYLYRLEVGGRRVAAWSTPMAVDRAWRGRTGAGIWLTRSFLRLAAERRSEALYMVNALVHPSSYIAMERQFANLHPHWERPMPPAVAGVLEAYGARLGLAPICPARPWVRAVGGVTRDTPPERDFWLRSSRGAVRFFLSNNPGYGQGHGLLAAARIGAADAARSVARLAGIQARRRLGRLLGRLGLGAPSSPAALRALVSGTELLSGTSEGALEALLSGRRLRAWSPGERVLQQGSRSESLFIVVKGAAYAMIEHDQGTPTILAELGPGEVFGEVGALLGRPRSATVRAAGTLWALELPAAALLRAADADPTLEQRLWRLVAGRSLASQLLESARFAHLDYDARRAVAAGTEVHHLGPGDALTLPAGRLVSVLSGRAELRLGGAWVQLLERALLRCPQPAHLLAHTPSVILVCRSQSQTKQRVP
jgi:CRP-like cAMP-binding protein